MASNENAHGHEIIEKNVGLLMIGIVIAISFAARWKLCPSSSG